jgi:hypothetical protein
MLAPLVPGAPQPLVEQYVRYAAIEACERTLAWRYEQDAIPLTAGVYSYDYEVPDDTEVVAVMHAAINGTPIKFITQDELHSLYPAWPDITTAARGTPAVLSQLDFDHFAVAPVPDSPTTAYSVKMFLALRPTPDSTSMDKVAFDELERLIFHGALKHLFAMPNTSWANQELSATHAKLALYDSTVRRARANLGAGRASLSVRMTPLA